MKKLLCLTIALLLLASALSGCSRSGTPADAPAENTVPLEEPQTTEVPEGHGEEDQSLVIDSLPTLEPVEPAPLDEGEQEAARTGADYFNFDAIMAAADAADAAPTQGSDAQGAPASDSAEGGLFQPQPTAAAQTYTNPDTFEFAALTNTTLGFVFNYPAAWENVPGVYTVCYRERVEPGDFPARVAISAKTMAHTPNTKTMTDQLTSYMHMVYRQYDSNTFEIEDPNEEDSFLGKKATSETYLAYYGEIEVKGYVVGAAVDRTIYVFHFCCPYEDYDALETMMRYMARSVQIISAQD